MFELFLPSGSHTIEAIQTRSIARPLCDSRASCSYPVVFNLHYLVELRIFAQNFNTNCPNFWAIDGAKHWRKVQPLSNVHARHRQTDDRRMDHANGVTFSTIIWLRCVSSTVRPSHVIHTAAPDRGKLVTLIAGNRRRLLFAGDDDEVFMTWSFNVTPKTTEQRLIVRSDKCKAAITNKKRLRSRYCTLYCWS